MTLSNRMYDILKWITTLLLPALGTLYFALASIWGFPYGEQIVGTLAAITTFLGVSLKISSANYTGDGMLVVDTSGENSDIYRLDLNIPVEDLAKKKTITFNVNPQE